MGVTKYLFFILTGLAQINWSHAETSTQTDKKRILGEILQNYDSAVRPSGINGTDDPVIVKVNIRLKKIISFSDYDMDFGIQIILRQEWTDDRLKYESDKIKYLSLPGPEKIWTPDIFFHNEKDSHLHKLSSSNHFVRIHPSGRVLYSARLSLTLWCQMQLDNFPFDTQECSISLSPYGQTAEDVVLMWREVDAIEITSYSNIVGFTLENVVTSSSPCNRITGEYSCLRVEMSFKRDLKYYIFHTFLPSTVLVVVSWTSFWMDRRAVVARILLVLSTLFAMSSLATEIEASVPHVPYVKAMDLWDGACFTFLLAALVEFAVVNANGPDETRDENTSVHKSVDSTQTPCKSNSESRPTSVPFYQGLLQGLTRDPSCIDSYARVFFPSAFLVFFVIYFITYAIQY